MASWEVRRIVAGAEPARTSMKGAIRNERRYHNHSISPAGFRLGPADRDRSRSLDALLPVLYLRGISTGDFQEALSALLGPEAANLSSGAITRLPAASDVMRAATSTVPHDLPVGLLLNRLAAQGTEVVPVTREGRRAGLLTRSDVIGLLLRGADDQRAA